MAKCTVIGFDDVEKALGKLASQKGLGIKCVKTAAPIVEDEMKKRIRAVANRADKKGHKYSTGGLADSVKATAPSENELGAYSVVKVNGQTDKGLDREQQLLYLEFGARHKKADGSYTQQEPRPVRSPTVAAVKDKILRQWEEIITEEVEDAFR